MLSRLSARSIWSRKFFPDLKHVRMASSEDGHTSIGKTIINKSKTTQPFNPKAACVELTGADVPQPLPFYGPERDNVNFPRTERLDEPGQTRLGFIPEEWFRFLYPKLGVSGPYTLGILFYYFLVSKEIYVIGIPQHEHFCAFWMWVYVIINTPIGQKLREVFSIPQKQFLAAAEIFNRETINLRKEAINHEKEEQWRQEGKQVLYDAKKENVGLQLEAVYRSNVMDVYKQVKRRLDYQVEVGKIDARIKQKFMVDWVIARVQESILKTSEKDTLKQCIADLNGLAARA